ncbi:MAG TPA: S41 family peptidase [Gemmatimonadaceae bacterium]|nr:S41 family peptidase [Gemmatimonadaceae bacterium]
MRSRAAVVVAVFGGAMVLGGALIQRPPAFGAFAFPSGATLSGSPSAGSRLFQEVLARVGRDYVDTISADLLYQKAVDGLMRELHDPHSVFLNADRLGRLTESTTGNYAGLGIQIDVRDGWITVITPLANTPAQRAGIETGDRIVEIEGKSTHGWTGDEALKALRGKPGDEVSFAVERPGVEGRMPFKLRRQVIHSSAVRRSALLQNGVGYVDVKAFSESTAREMQRAIDSLSRQGMKSLIFDLRDNPGGLLDQGVSVSDLFLDAGQPIVSMRGRTRDATREFLDEGKQRWPDLPIVVLVNDGSASASEIVAGALQDHDRAVLVGTTTYGKGSAQSVFRMPGGGALKLTTARWYTPSGRSINRLPKVEADGDADDAAAEGDSAGSAPLSQRQRFKTDAGRTVLGGGAITPDVLIPDQPASEADLAFQRALGQAFPKFRDALTEYAVSLRVARSVSSPDFAVTPAMREALWQRMTKRGIAMNRAVYDSSAGLVDRLLGREIARYALGGEAEFRRAVRDDRAVQAALELLSGAAGRSDLLARAARHEASAADSATKK